MMLRFEQLNSKSHDRNSFDCGVEPLNIYLKRFANQDQKRRLSTIYVLCDEQRIIGYYSLSAHSVSRNHLPENYSVGSYQDIPFLLLGRLAVDRASQGNGYGDALIMHAFATTADTAKNIGILGMIVDAKDDKAVSFYKGFGFQPLAESPNRLALPLTSMENLLKKN